MPRPNIGSGPGSCASYGRAGLFVGSSLVQDKFIVDVAAGDGSRMTNYSTTLPAAFSAIASVGAAGCGFEQPLEAMRLALLDPTGEHVGFLRPEARLAVITLQDEDDCSFAHSALLGSDTETLGPLQSFRCARFGVTCEVNGKTPDEMSVPGDKGECHANDRSPYIAPIERYRRILETAKPDPRDVMFATIAGDPAPVTVELRTPPGGGGMAPALQHTCGYQGQNGTHVADPAVRMVDLATQLHRGYFETGCKADFTPVVHSIGRNLRALLGDTCLPIAHVGECKVFAQTLNDERELPRCGTVTTDCYELVDDAGCGGGARAMATWSLPPSSDTMLSVRCR